MISILFSCGRYARPETLLIDSTTGDVEPARRVCSLAAARNCIYIDAPVSGGVVAAKEHRLTFIVGARRKEHYDRALPFLNAMGARTVRIFHLLFVYHTHTFCFDYLTLSF